MFERPFRSLAKEDEVGTAEGDLSVEGGPCYSTRRFLPSPVIKSERRVKNQRLARFLFLTEEGLNPARLFLGCGAGEDAGVLW